VRCSAAQIYPEQVVPVDGVVSFGSSAVEQAVGILYPPGNASRRSTKSRDSLLWQGTHNAWGTMRMSAWRAYKHSVMYSLVWAFHRALTRTLSSGAHLLRGLPFLACEVLYAVCVLLLAAASLLLLSLSASALLALALLLARPRGLLRTMYQSVDLGRFYCVRECVLFCLLLLGFECAREKRCQQGMGERASM
jgi:cation transport ATPase